MIKNVIIYDFTENIKTNIFLTETQFEKMESVWNNEDRILVEMQDNEIFNGCTRWCDLSPFHLRLMITQNLNMAMPILLEEKKHHNNPIMDSLKLLLSALVLCLQRNAECSIEILKICRFDENKVNFDFSANLISIPNRSRVDLRVIVDNE